MTNARTTWKILLDTPASKPELGFDQTAAALASVILHTRPQFSVGIFGGWGSGKTTLMAAIAGHLRQSEHVVIVDFNAWRFEREPLLLVPLLDTIRDGLLRWSATTADALGKARTAAGRIGRVVEALAAG
jgi:predicted KAP-like P-loop ATPase